MGPRQKWSPVQSPHTLQMGSLLGLTRDTGTVLVPLRNSATVAVVLAFPLSHVAQVHSLPRIPELPTKVPEPDTFMSESLAGVPRLVQGDEVAGRVPAYCGISSLRGIWSLGALMSAPHFLASLIPMTYIWFPSLSQKVLNVSLLLSPSLSLKTASHLPLFFLPPCDKWSGPLHRGRCHPVASTVTQPTWDWSIQGACSRGSVSSHCPGGDSGHITLFCILFWSVSKAHLAVLSNNDGNRFTHV